MYLHLATFQTYLIIETMSNFVSNNESNCTVVHVSRSIG